ncbi:hypothetical protein DFH08DRAFT_744616, partial [Mycena albidolilacea]
GKALQAASGIGRRDIVELLLEHGANSTEISFSPVQGSRHGCAIQAAVYRANLDIIGCFSRLGQTEIILYGTALQVAVHGGNLQIVQLLLEHGANGKAPGRRVVFCSRRLHRF